MVGKEIIPASEICLEYTHSTCNRFHIAAKHILYTLAKLSLKISHDVPQSDYLQYIGK